MSSLLRTFLASTDEAEHIALSGIRLFFLLLIVFILRHIPHLFLRWDGWSHRTAGALQLFWLIYGVLNVISPSPAKESPLSSSWMYQCIGYDVVLGCLGITATLTAAKDFPHRRIENAPGQSGTLSRVAVVTQNEMIEHSFYQALNLLQALYLHGMGYYLSSMGSSSSNVLSLAENGRKMMALLLVTSPWLVRRWFPVNSFSANWTTEKQRLLKRNQSSSGPSQRRVSTITTAAANKTQNEKQQQQLEILLYQIKKWQYVFYKHVILHGLNISVAFPSPSFFPSSSITTQAVPFTATASWRIFWLALNTSYVMEFFMQTLVKRRVLTQNTMLMLQRLLMGASSVAAIAAICNVVRPGVAVVSLLMNFVHRGHDVVNTVLVGVLASVFPWL